MISSSCLVCAPTSRNQENNKRSGRYTGNSEEEAGLLGAQYDAEEEYDEPTRITTPVRYLLPLNVPHLKR
jgi:hypothetical protein